MENVFDSRPSDPGSGLWTFFLHKKVDTIVSECPARIIILLDVVVKVLSTTV